MAGPSPETAARPSPPASSASWLALRGGGHPQQTKFNNKNVAFTLSLKSYFFLIQIETWMALLLLEVTNHMKYDFCAKPHLVVGGTSTVWTAKKIQF